MRGASYQPVWDPDLAISRRRAIVFAIVLLVHLFVVFLLFRWVAAAPTRPIESNPIIVQQLQPEQRPSPRPAPHPSTAIKLKPNGGGAPPKQSNPAAATAPAQPTSNVQLNLLSISLADSDISKMPAHARPDHGNADGDSAGKDSGSHYGPGGGAGGDRYYLAQWYTKPPRAALDSYMPSGGPHEGWGEIVCKTIPDYRVEDCHELGETPGSGFARAMRQAAWQFRVRPERIGGKDQIGSLVRIRYDFYVVNKPEGSGGDPAD